MIDDATSKIPSGKFFESETTLVGIKAERDHVEARDETSLLTVTTGH